MIDAISCRLIYNCCKWNQITMFQTKLSVQCFECVSDVGISTMVATFWKSDMEEYNVLKKEERYFVYHVARCLQGEYFSSTLRVGKINQTVLLRDRQRPRPTDGGVTFLLEEGTGWVPVQSPVPSCEQTDRDGGRQVLANIDILNLDQALIGAGKEIFMAIIELSQMKIFSVDSTESRENQKKTNITSSLVGTQTPLSFQPCMLLSKLIPHLLVSLRLLDP